MPVVSAARAATGWADLVALGALMDIYLGIAAVLVIVLVVTLSLILTRGVS